MIKEVMIFFLTYFNSVEAAGDSLTRIFTNKIKSIKIWYMTGANSDVFKNRINTLT